MGDDGGGDEDGEMIQLYLLSLSAQVIIYDQMHL